MKPIERTRIFINNQNATAYSDWFALNNVDRVRWQVDKACTATLQTTQDWDASAKAPTNWIDTETQSPAAAANFVTDVETRYGRFKLTSGTGVTLKGLRAVASRAKM